MELCNPNEAIYKYFVHEIGRQMNSQEEPKL